MERILDKQTMIVTETDEKGVITYANHDFCELCMYTKDELIGQPHNIVRHNDMPKEAFRMLWSTIQSGKVWSGIVKNRAKDGSYYWVKATVYPSFDTHEHRRYISIRVKATPQEIQEAQTLYESLR